MKKLILLFAVLICSLQSNAQMWCPPGATWHYRVNMLMMPYYDGHLKLNVTNTVTLNSIVCHNMVGTFNGKAMSANGPVTTINNFINFQTYENNKVVYIYNTSTSAFDTIANFNANIGDKWLIIRFPFVTCANNPVRKPITVIDTGHVTINSINLKRVTVSVPYQTSGTYTVNMIEKISSLLGFMFHSFDSNCATDGSGYGSFVCYSDNNFVLYNPTSTVCDYLPVGINENLLLAKSLKLFPNPNTGVFTIEIDKASKLSVYNTLGALVYETNFSEAGNFKMDISHLAKGIYNVKTENTSGSSFTKLIKE